MNFDRRSLLKGGAALGLAGAANLTEFAKAWAQTSPWKPEPGAQLSMLRWKYFVQTEDDAFVALTHASGARSHLWCSAAASWPGPRLVLQGTTAGWSLQDLDGQEDALRAGTSYAGEADGVLWTADGARSWPTVPGRWTDFYARFADAVDGRGPVPVETRDAVRVLEVLEAARRSATERVVVPL